MNEETEDKQQNSNDYPNQPYVPQIPEAPEDRIVKGDISELIEKI